MSRRRSTVIEDAYARLESQGDKEYYPDPEKSRRGKRYKIEFKSNSTFVTTTHFVKSLLSPAILAIPSGFQRGGLIFSIFGYLFLLSLVSYNMKRLIDNASHLSSRERVTVRTYDEVAYVSFNTCSESTRSYASTLKMIVNILFIITYLDACTIFMIFVARNIEVIVIYYYPETIFSVRHFLFFQVALIMLMASIRDLKLIAPFSFVSLSLLLVAAVMTVSFFFLRHVPSVWDRAQIGTVHTVPKFFSVVSFSLSGISIALTLKSSMLHPEKFFSFPGVFCIAVLVKIFVFVPFGYLGYLKYGPATQPSIMLNLPMGNNLAMAIKFIAILSILLTTPLVFYVAFNVLWNNFVKSTILKMTDSMFAEFCLRYALIIVSFSAAVALPDLGVMIALKGALLHSHLEITIPALLDYVTNYPVTGSGRYHYRLIRAVSIILFGIVLCIWGTVIAIYDLVIQGIPRPVITI